MMKVVLLCCLLVVAKADSGGGSGGFGSSGVDCGGSGGTGSGGFSGSGGFGGSGGTGSGGSGGDPCYAIDTSACDDYDYDQAGCEEATDCMWDDLNGCDMVVHANEPECEPDCSGRCGGESDGCDGSCDEECAGGCVHDFTEMGAADCDVAWGEFGVNCAALASNYGWDCEGCSCPGDEAGTEEEGEQEESGCVHDFTEMGAANCDVAWSSFGVNCASLQSDYAWDCEGCSCPGDEAEEEEQGEQETSGCGGSGGSGSGGSGSGCGDEGASMCDEYDYDQAACEEHSEYRDEDHYHCVWDDLNGCDMVLHPHEIECENPCPEDFAETAVCATTDWENATEEDLCHCAISIHDKNGNSMPDCGYPSPLGNGCRTTHETLDICKPEWQEPECDNECPEGFNDTEVCNTTDWENVTEEALCHCAMSIAKKMGANMPECQYSSPFGDGCRNTHETIRRCTPEAEPTFMCGEHADDNGCLEQCGCRWVADNNADKANADNADNADKAPRPRGFCLDDSAEEAIAALLGMDEMHVMSLLNLATNEEFAQMAADHNIDLKDISAHDLAYDMYHTSDSDRLINSITNLESMELSEKMAVGNVFKQLNEAMSGDNKGFCEDDKEAGAMTVVATGAAVVAALGAILM